MNRQWVPLMMLAVGIGLMTGACSQAAPPPAPTAAPATPIRAAEPAKPTAPPVEGVLEPTRAAIPSAQPVALSRQPGFPDRGKAITVVVPWPAGGSVDAPVRPLVALLERELAASMPVVNKPGATTQIGMTEMVSARPDGYTIGTVSFGATIVTYLDAERKAVYNRSSFQPISHYVAEDNVIAVKAASPFTDLKALADAAKAAPGQVKVGTAGVMSNTHMGPLMFEDAAGIKFSYVHFQGTAMGLTAMLEGSIDAICAGAGGVMAQSKAGLVRVLGTMTREPSKLYPGVRTFDSFGYRVYMYHSIGVAAPAGIPKEAVSALNGAIQKVMAGNPELHSRLNDMGYTPWFMDTAEYEAYWREFESNVKPLLQRAKEQTK